MPKNNIPKGKNWRYCYHTTNANGARMAEKGINPKMLQYLMGHSDIKTTLSYYIDVTDTMINEAKDGMEKMVNF